MLKYEKLNTELINYVKNKEETLPIEINGFYYYKVPVSEEILFIMRMLENHDSFTGDLALCLNTKKECVLQVFYYGTNLLKNSSENIKEFEYLKMLDEFSKALEEEFIAVIENLEFDEILLKDSEVIERANESRYKKLEYKIPKVEYLTELDFFTFGEILNDVHDAAYSYLERYLAKNPAYLRECQRIFAINKLIDENRNSIGYVSVTGMEDAKEIISNIFKNSDYKSVKITLETNKNDEYTESIKVTPAIIDALPPIYSIKKITWRKNVLYERPSDETLITMYKESLDENLQFLERANNYKGRFTLPVDSFFVKSLFKNPLFMINYYRVYPNKKNYFSLIDESLLDNLDFALDLINHIGLFDLVELESIYNLFSNLKNEEQFCLSFFNKRYGYKLFRHFPINIQQNKNVIKVFIEKTTERFDSDYREIYENLTSKVLNSDDLVSFVENLLLPHYPATYNLDIADKYKNKEFLYRICIFENRIPKEFQDGTISIVDDDFMRDFIQKTNFIPDFIWAEFETSFKHLLKEEEIQLEILCKIDSSHIKKIEKLLEIVPNLLTFDNLELVFSKNTFLVDILIPYCSVDVQIDFLKIHKEYIKSIFNYKLFRIIDSDSLTDKVFDVLDGLYKLNDLSYFASLTYLSFKDDAISELLKRYPSLFECLGSRRNVAEELKSETFLLPYIKQKHWNSGKLLTDKDYIKKQAKLNPLVLQYLNTPRKNSYLNSLHSDRDFVLEMIHLEPKNIYGLWKKSPFFDDVSFAKEVVSLIPDAKKLFTKRVQKEIES